jgi:hypothetical protein
LPPEAPPPPAAVPAPQADANLLQRDLLFGNPDHVLPSLSPNGNQIAFIAPDNGVLNVWVGPANDIKSAKVVTHERVRPIRFFLWAYTNEHIVYVNDKGGDENFHIFVADLKAGKEEDLTPFEGVRAQLLDRYDTKPNVVLVEMNKRDKRFMDPVLIDIKTKAITVLAENTEGYADYVADQDAKLRMASKMMPEGGIELFTPGKPGEWKSYAKIPQEDSQTTDPVSFEKNNRTLYFKDSRGRDTSALVAIDMPDGNPRCSSRTPRPTSSNFFCTPSTYVLYPDEGHGFARPENRLSFYAVAEVFLAEHLGGKYLPTGDDFQNSSIKVPGGAEHIFGLQDALSAKK